MGSDIKVPCPLVVYVVSDSIVASAGINPSHLIIGLCHKSFLVHEVRNCATQIWFLHVYNQYALGSQYVNYEGVFSILIN